MEHNEFLQHIDKLCDHLRKYIQDNKIKIDYICPVLRSGAVPATYISNKLNIIKYLVIIWKLQIPLKTWCQIDMCAGRRLQTQSVT